MKVFESWFIDEPQPDAVITNRVDLVVNIVRIPGAPSLGLWRSAKVIECRAQHAIGDFNAAVRGLLKHDRR
jgi:hypothetical protein